MNVKRMHANLGVGSDVQGDGQALVRFDAGQCGVQSHFSHRDAHAVGAQVAEAEDALAVGDHNGPHVRLGPVAQDVVDVALVMDGDEEAARSPKHQTKLLARQAHRWRVHDWHHGLHVFGQQTVKEVFVAILITRHKGDVLVITSFLPANLFNSHILFKY